MKKVFTSLLVISAMAFTGCSSFFADPIAAHNGLVDHMDTVLNAEEVFYDNYYVIEEGDDTAELISSYDEFAQAESDLATYMTETTFSSDQDIFVQQYNELYSPALSEYVETAGQFIDMVKTDGFSYESADNYIEFIDEQAYAFIEVHNSFTDTINLQADY